MHTGMNTGSAEALVTNHFDDGHFVTQLSYLNARHAHAMYTLYVHHYTCIHVYSELSFPVAQWEPCYSRFTGFLQSMNMFTSHEFQLYTCVFFSLTLERRRKKNKIHTTYWNFKLNPLHLSRRDFVSLLLFAKQLHNINWCTILCVTRSFSPSLNLCLFSTL